MHTINFIATSDSKSDKKKGNSSKYFDLKYTLWFNFLLHSKIVWIEK